MKLKIMTFVICLAALNVKAQTDSTATTPEKATLTLAAIYGNNVSYYGQGTLEKLPYILTNATFRLPLGLFFSASSYKLLNYGTGMSASDLGIGFDHAFSPKLQAGISYTRSFFPEDSPLLQAANENNINAMVDYQWPWFKSSLSTDFAFGLEKDVFISLNHAKLIELGSLFNENDQIAIEPAVELVAGTQHFLESYTQKKNQGKGKGSGNENTTETIEIPTTSFNLLTYNFKIPFTYSRSHYMAEFAYQYSILGGKIPAETKNSQSFFNLSFYYQF
ncbi:hypothetical protein [Pedobacter immunditicola]|uniref:hypothetical protein n=1 Tax=Pedobacter immunditicola TaxID=3133440 RepID=UPI0030984E4C